MLSGVNKTCQQCVNECEQYEQVRLISCPNYKSDIKIRCTLTQGENASEPF